MLYEDPEGNRVNYTYEQFNLVVNRVANGLLKLGVKNRDKINIHLTNRPEFLFFWFASAKIGAVIVPTNPLSPPDELSYPLQHSECILSVTESGLLPTVKSIFGNCPKLKKVIVCGEGTYSGNLISYNKFILKLPSTLPEFDINPLDDAAVMYTSGTTARPKGVMVTHANYIYAGEVVSKVMRLTPTDRHLVVLPLFHGNAQYYSFMTSLVVGCSVAMMSKFSASKYMAQASNYGCTVASLFAAPIRMILAQQESPGNNQHKLRLAIFAQSISETQLCDWSDRFDIPLMQIYGMTETMGHPIANPLDYQRKNMAMGMVTLGYECKVVGINGQQVPTGTNGELLVHGTPGVSITKGYLNNLEATNTTIKDGWLWTGDIVKVDDEGYFYFVDRAKDMIKRAGENVAAGEVESVIKQNSKVADAVVIGIPDEMRDESIKAFVILKNDATATEDEIVEFCKQRLSKFRVPEFVEFRSEFPVTSVGKIQKHILRQEEAKRSNI